VCVCNLLRNFVCLISTDMFPRKFVDYNTSSCAYSHTKRHVSAHFPTYKDMSLRYIQHLTPFLSPNFPLMYLKRCTHDFNLQLLLTMQLLTYKDVSVCKLSHMRTPNFSCFISTTMFPHKCVAYETRSCACSHTTRRVSAHFLTYEDMSMHNI